MIFLEGPFLLIGVIAWTAAIVLGVGAWFEAWDWRDRWAWAGGLAGLGTFELLLYARSGMLEVLVPSAQWVVFASAALFVGCGLALSYGTLYLSDRARARALKPPTEHAERRLWVLDQVDRLRPERADWLLTGAMIAPCVGMGYLGLVIAGSTGLAVVGALCALGPVSAAIALRNRAREVRRLEEEF